MFGVFGPLLSLDPLAVGSVLRQTALSAAQLHDLATAFKRLLDLVQEWCVLPVSPVVCLSDGGGGASVPETVRFSLVVVDCRAVSERLRAAAAAVLGQVLGAAHHAAMQQCSVLVRLPVS
jgi:hypothetical protein